MGVLKASFCDAVLGLAWCLFAGVDNDRQRTIGLCLCVTLKISVTRRNVFLFDLI